MKSYNVIVVGGGVIGLSIAYLLGKEGVQTLLLERGELGSGASWAGAGILSPPAKRPGPSALDQLRSRSAVLHELWTHALREETGIDNGWMRSGGIDLALEPGDVLELARASRIWDQQGIEYETVDRYTIQNYEPLLTTKILSARFTPERAQVRNPWHLRALAQACEKLGVHIVRNAEVERLKHSLGRIQEVQTEGAVYVCGELVLAAGAWSSELLESIGVDLATPPVKGEIVLLQTSTPNPKRIVEWGSRYLVPRADGRVLVGSTEILDGFDARPRAESVRELIDAAIRLCPALARAVVERAWAGLRPGNSDGRPTIGRPAQFENLIVATGHKRNGIQLSTATAEAVVDLLARREPTINLLELSPNREPGEPIEQAFRS